MRVLLLHAFPLDPGMWDAQRPVLEGHDVVAPTIYSRGNSMDAWASSILGEVEGSFVAVGASMGGGCALAMARQEPARVEAIVLAGAHAGPDPAERRPQREATIGKIRAEGAASIPGHTSPTLSPAPEPTGTTSRFLSPVERDGGERLLFVAFILGALIGGFIATALGIGRLGHFFDLGTWLIAIGGSVLLLLAINAIANRRRI